VPVEHGPRERVTALILIGVVLPFTPLAATLGLVPLPGAYFAPNAD